VVIPTVFHTEILGKGVALDFVVDFIDARVAEATRADRDITLVGPGFYVLEVYAAAGVVVNGEDEVAPAGGTVLAAEVGLVEWGLPNIPFNNRS